MRISLIGHQFSRLLESGQRILALHLQCATQQLPAEAEFRILPEQRACPAFQFRVAARVIQRDERVDFSGQGCLRQGCGLFLHNSA